MSSPSSLFSEVSTPDEQRIVAARSTPPIPGLYIFPGLLSPELAHETLEAIAHADHFSGGTRDQVMLFTSPPSDPQHSHSGLPEHLSALLSGVEILLRDKLPTEVFDLVFNQPLARQSILNLYPPGQGITPHIDLPNRYADGILGVSLIGGATMTFTKEEGDGRWDVYLPPRSIYVLSGTARWEWAHGIEGRYEDLVEGARGGEMETVLRDLRVSVTYRWMKEGGEVLS